VYWKIRLITFITQIIIPFLMNIVYLESPLFGTFYDPESHDAVVVPNLIEKIRAYMRPGVIAMKDSYNPWKDPKATKTHLLDVEPEVFEKLKDAAQQHDQDAVNDVIKQYLPPTEIP
jgi:hypothetical protein